MKVKCKTPRRLKPGGYTDEARLRGLRIRAKYPQRQAWGYTDEARLRGLRIRAKYPQRQACGF